ncbi:plexin-A4-like [Planococcus citri]|uniref:plexin-A4-like n=1 Tax=Planococcus citri TaxID=170843 RepID=UPI0031FA0D2F
MDKSTGAHELFIAMNVRKLLPILLIHALIFCSNTNNSNANPVNETWQVFSDENVERFSRLAVDENGRWVYISARNRIYQLSTDLELQINYTISELSPSDCTAPNCSHKLKQTETDTDNWNDVLVLDYQNQQLISCGTFFSGICHAHEMSNISKIWTIGSEPIAKSSSYTSIVAVIAPNLLKNLSTPLSTLYVGITVDNDVQPIQVITIENLEREHFSSVLTQNTTSHFTKKECSTANAGFIIYGFSYENVGYLITMNNHDLNDRIGGYLIVADTHKNNLCDKVPIVCTSASDETFMGIILYAYIQERHPDSGTKTDSHEMEETTMMFTLLHKSSVKVRVSSVQICRHKINKLNSLIQKDEPLIGDLIFSDPEDKEQITSMVATSINNYTILFLGTGDGRLLKISIKGVDSLALFTADKYADITIDSETSVGDMQFDSTMNFLYVMTEKKLTKLKIHNCDEYNTSHACLEIKDPYCGWCFPCNRCCLKSECDVEQNHINWISYDIDKYIDASSSPATNISRTAESNVTLKLITSHPFVNHAIICSFDFGNFSIDTTTMCNKNSINCVTPTTNHLPPTLIDNHSIGAELSVHTNHFPVFQKIHIIFYDCNTYGSCLSCMTSPYPCLWYANEYRCTDITIWKEEDIVMGMNFSSTHFPGLNSRALYDGNKFSKNVMFCPQFFTDPISDIYIPAHTVKTQQIQVHYKIPIWLPYIPQFTCKFVFDSNKEKIQFVQCGYSYTPGGGVIEGRITCDHVIFAYAESKPFITVELHVLWNGSIPIDNTYNTHIVVYKCAHMGNECIACLNKNYSCMWNSETEECKYYSLNDTSNITDPWLHDIQNCSNSTIFQEILQKNPSTNWLTENIHLIIPSIVAVTFTVVAVFVIYRKSTVKSRKMQQQINKMGMEMISMSQCVKRVVIENEIELNENESDILRLPNVNIVYEPFSTSSENETERKNEYELLLDETWEIPRENLVLGKFLGEGEFGRVVKGNVSGLFQQDIVTTVAVKMLKKKHTDVDMVNLVKEMELMKLIGRHDNVLGLLGCCTQDGPLLIITEYSPHGNLLDFLRNHNRDLSTAQEPTSIDLSETVLITFALQVAKGMEYLASIKCIHRDLAARNVLVFDDYVVKIADFGLARDIRHEYYYRQKTTGRFPVKWMAPESLKHCRYTIQSDVWSYGVLLWEIMTFGTVPYLAYDDAEKLVKDIKAGYRMNKPDDCPEMLYCLMRKCWNYLPKDRPDFTTIIRELHAIILAAENVVMEQPDSQSSNITTESDHEESETDSLLKMSR